MTEGGAEDRSDELFLLCREVIDLTVTPEHAVEKLLEMQKDCSAIPSLLLDVLYACEHEPKDETESKRIFMQFIELVAQQLICRDVLAMELDCLEASTPANKQQLVRLKTRLYFRQSKFNLLREESEGYAKLITELLECDGVSPKAIMTRLLCIIGQFNLDPNRVTDVVLDCFECCYQKKEFFISLLREIKANREYLCTLLGFKFTFYQQKEGRTPFSLYQLTAVLVEADLVDLMKITTFMVPQAEGIKESHKSRTANAAERSKKAGTIMTSHIPVESARNSNAMNDPLGSSDGSQSISGISFAVVAAIQDAEDEKLTGELNEDTVLATNQKLGLLCALVEEGAWSLAKQLIDRLPEYYAVQASPRVSKAIADLIDAAIDDFYRKNCYRGLPITVTKQESPSSGIDKVTSWTELAAMSSNLWYLGPRLAYRPRTVTKIVRLLTVFYKERANGQHTESEEETNIFMDIVDEVLLPGLSLNASSPNASMSEELWQLLQLFPYAWRYRLYGRWKTIHTIRHPEINVTRGKIYGRTKYVFKRLSKETVKVMGRQIGKLCHVHPITVFEYLLSQVQTFDNFIGPVVESIRFLTSLEFDILSYCIIEQLASPEKEQLKASDGTLSPWLQALGTLVGAIYKKYTVEIGGILNYVANQLKNGKSFDLLILREIIQSMSSVESNMGATQEQLDALQGGEVLRLEAGGFSNVRNKRASNRLRDALLEGDLAVGLAILIAQQRECIVYRDSELLPLKLVGEMVDQCRDTLMQLVSFLLSNVKHEEFARRIPPAHLLISEFHVPLATAIYLVRSTFLPRVNAAYDASKKSRKLLETEDGRGSRLDTQMKFLFFKTAMDEVVGQLITELGPCIPKQLVGDIPIRMIVVFWMFSLYDIEVPTNAYEKAIEAAKKQAKEAGDNMDMSKSKRVKEEERLRGVEGRLKDEMKKQTEHVERIRMWLSQGKEDLFDHRNNQVHAFLQLCIIPRAIFSELDAIYCARMVILLHQQRTTFFQTLIFIDKTFNDFLPLVSGLTENEAACLGKFLEMLLSHTMKWHAEKSMFEKECEGYPGFISKLIRGEDVKQEIKYEEFRTLCYKWQTKMMKAVLAVLSKPDCDYTLLRNTLVVATKMVSCFPMVKDQHEQVASAMDKVRDNEKGKRGDLSLKAASYAGRFKLSGAKLWDRENFAKVKPTVKANGVSGSQPVATEDERKPSKTVTSTPEAKKRSIKTEKTEKTSASDETSKQRREKLKEMKMELGTEEGEATPSPPAKKSRMSSAIEEHAPAQNGKDKEKEKDSEAHKSREKPKKDKERRREKSRESEKVRETDKEREPSATREEKKRRDKSADGEVTPKADKRRSVKVERAIEAEFAGPAPPPVKNEPDECEHDKRKQIAPASSAKKDRDEGEREKRREPAATPAKKERDDGDREKRREVDGKNDVAKRDSEVKKELKASKRQREEPESDSKEVRKERPRITIESRLSTRPAVKETRRKEKSVSPPPRDRDSRRDGRKPSKDSRPRR